MSEETVGCVWSEGTYAVVRQLLDGRYDNLLLLASQQSVVACMRIERQHGDARVRDAEVAFQRIVEYRSLLYDALFGYSRSNVSDGQMCGYESHAQHVVEQYHESLVAIACTLLDIFGVAAEMEVVALYVVLVDRCRYEHVEQSLFVVGHCLFESCERCHASLFRRIAKVNLYLLIESCEQIHLVVVGFGSRVDYGEVALNAESIAVIGCHLGRAVDDRCA